MTRPFLFSRRDPLTSNDRESTQGLLSAPRTEAMRAGTGAFIHAFRAALGASLGSSAAIQALGIVTGTLLARVLGPTDRGALAAILLWPALLPTLGAVGLPEALTYYTARRPAEVRTWAATGIATGVVQSAVLCTIGFAIAPFALHRFGADAVRDARFALLQMPFAILTVACGSVLNGLQRFRAFQVVRLTVVAVAAAALVALAATGALTTSTAVWAYIAANALTFAVSVALLARAGGLGRVLSRPSWAAGRELLTYGAKSHVGVLGSTLNERLDQLIISLVLSPAQLGFYVSAVAIASATSIVGSSVAIVALPAVAAIGDLPERVRAARNFTRLTLVSGAVLCVPLVVLMPQLVRLLFGPAFAPSVDAARILVLAGVVLGVVRVLGANVRSFGRPFQAALGDVAGAGVTVVGLLALLPVIGIDGAAVTSLVAYTVTMAYLRRELARGAARRLSAGATVSVAGAE